jgi:hypothetical protein
MFGKTYKEEKFWEWFIANEYRYYTQTENQKELFDELSYNLELVESNLTFAFSPIRKNGIREFTISADGVKKYFPIVQSLVEKSPKINNWQINAFRQRIPGDSMKIIYDNQLAIGYQDIYFRYAEDFDKIGLELNVKNFDDSSNLKNAIYVLMDGLIGEYDMETQISWIEFKLLDETKVDQLYPLIELRGFVDTRKKKQLD